MLYRLSYVSSDVVIRIWSFRIKFRKRSVDGAAMERETGIEPAPSAWKAEVLPLNYSRIGMTCHNMKLVEGGGFEPPKA